MLISLEYAIICVVIVMYCDRSCVYSSVIFSRYHIMPPSGVVAFFMMIACLLLYEEKLGAKDRMRWIDV